MADIDRDLHERRYDEQRIYSTGGGAAGWWIAGVLALAVLIIGFIALSGGNPAPVEGPAGTAPVTETAPAATEPAPLTDAAPAEGTAPAPAAPAEEAAPAEAAPAESSAAPATEEAVPAQ